MTKTKLPPLPKPWSTHEIEFWPTFYGGAIAERERRKILNREYVADHSNDKAFQRVLKPFVDKYVKGSKVK